MSLATSLDRRSSRPFAAGALLAAFTGALFLSAFLLFAVQPMVARMVLPKLGGAPAVWSVSMVFFQAALLGGYAYAHWLARRFDIRRGAAIHLGVMAVAALALPIALTDRLGPPPTDGAATWLGGVLALSVGAPFLALSANGPLLQAWFARTSHPQAADPYFLYGASNIGSFAALLLYPLAIEPLAGLRDQSLGWTAGFVLLAAAIVLAAIGAGRAQAGAPALAAAPVAHRPSSRRAVLTWTALAFVPSALLVAVTAHVTTDIAAAPFLWVLPLALFLLTFVVTFQRRPVLPHRWMLVLQPPAIGVLLLLTLLGIKPHPAVQLALHLGTFFLSAMVAHGELAGRRPPAAELTRFYLCLSLGGVLGGAFAALLAPALFRTVAEYPILLVAALLVRAAADGAERPWRGLALGLAAGALIAGLRYAEWGLLQAAFAGVAAAGLFAAFVLWRTATLRLAAVAAAVFLGDALLAPENRGADVLRSFFGVHRVVDTEDGRFRLLFNGTTVHGAMRLRDEAGAPVSNPQPTTYFHPDGAYAAAIAVARADRPALRAAVIGLGAGSLAAYRRPGDDWTFLEIDPAVADIARDPARFRFLAQAGDAIPIVLGDARLTLERFADGSLDLVIFDAFSSDSVPVHLLTVEALQLAARKLAPGGRIALNITNRNLDLPGVVAAGARAAGLAAVIRRDRLPGRVTADLRANADIAVLAPDPATLRPLGAAGFEPLAAPEGVAPWTDDYANLPAALWRRWQAPY